jgi:hypothetical protein
MFFVNFMQYDKLGQICRIHMALADVFCQGTRDPMCTTLASLVRYLLK